MAYNCVVCVKQVPDTKRITGQAMKEDGTVNRAALPAVFNPEDLNALEQALAVRNQHGGTVTVLTMGLPTACDVLREALFRGADRAILLTDRRAAASDTLATSYILACAVKKLRPNIVLCGRQAIDGDTAQTGPQPRPEAQLHTHHLSPEGQPGLTGDRIVVKHNVGNGFEVVAARLPVCLTVMDTANVPRPQAAKRIMKYKKARSTAELAKSVEDRLGPEVTVEAKAAETKKLAADFSSRGLLIEQWNLDDVQADLAWCGRNGSPTKVHRIQSVVLTGGAYKEYPASDQGVTQLISELIEEHTIG